MNTKLLRRMISFLLCFAMLGGIILLYCPSGVYAAEEVYQWDNGNIVDYVHYIGEKSYLDNAPFGYAYFYQGTDPSDSRNAGFYDMILAVNGGNNWFKNRYYCGATDAETAYNNRTAAIHLAAVTYPTYHYSTGYVFTAPHTGTVEFTYQYAAVNTDAVGMPFYVMRESDTGYGDALQKLTATKIANVNDKSVSEYDEITFAVDMTAGEKIYFVADSDASAKAFGHWISSVRYLPVVESMTVDKTGYVSGDSITVTTTFSDGILGTNDYITITRKGETVPVVKKTAASLVCFDEWLTAGEYEIALLIDGLEGSAASVWIQVYTPSAVAWDNGDIIDYVHYTGEKNYLDNAPFGYAFYYEGTDPKDTRFKGFYDMVMASNDGTNTWCNGRYFCSTNPAEVEGNNRTAAIHLAAVTYPTYHYSTGYVFTAPQTGTVEFTYQYAAANASAVGMPFYIMRQNSAGYGDAVQKLTAAKTVSVTDKTSSAYDEITFTVEMTAGEKLYFIADSDVSSKAFAHWISSVKLCSHANETSYDIAPTLSNKGYTQIACAECDKKLYTKNEIAPLTCVDSWSLTLGSDLGVNFRFAIDETIRDTAQISIAVGDDAPVIYSAMNDTVWDNSDDPHCLLTVHVSAAQMQDEIKVQILNGDDASEVKTYTVEAYARVVLENKAMRQYHQVLKDILNYGAAAQIYFRHNHEGALPNAGITGFGNATIPTEVVTEQIAAGAVDGIHFYGASLVYRERIAVRLYFSLTSGSIEEYNFCTTDGNTLSPVFKDGLYYVEFADILPNQLNTSVTCYVLKGEQSLQVQYAPLDYIIRMNNKETSSTELTDTLKALYNYHLSTYALTSTDAIMIGSNKLLSMIREGTIEENGNYTVTDEKGITFDQTDNLQTYDLKNATICISTSNGNSGLTVQADGMALKNGSVAIYGGTVLTVDGKDVTLSNLHFSGDGQAALKLEGIGTTVKDCTFQPDTGASLLQGIVATRSDITVSGSSFVGLTEAIADQSGNGLVVENNTFENCLTGVSVQTSGTTVWHNDFSGGDCAVSAQFEKSELSAAEADGHNLLIANNQITGAKTSVICRNTSNSVILLNQMESAAIEGNTNIYVCENTLSGQMTLTGNNYLICNKNTASNLTAQNNTNVNGDNVTDLTARAEVGANEELLPHINTEQFVGMENREIRTADSETGLTQYIKNKSECETVIIVPPGKYTGSRVELADLEGVTIYAYGVYNEVDSSGGYAVNMANCTDCTVNGMFLGYQTYPHIQGTIVELADSNKTVVFQPDPGYIQDYSVIGTFEGRVFDNGINFGLVQYQEKSYDTSNGLNTLLDCTLWGDISVGDRIAFRNPNASGGFYFNNCSKTTLEDVTIFNCSGFAESDVNNEIAPVLHRYAITQGPAPILAGLESDYNSELVYTDSYGRIRSAAPILTTLDGTHSTNARTGIQIISSLFEGTDDDMTNINGYYGLAEDYNEAEHTLTYGLSNVNGYQRLPATFRTGDQLEMFTFDGQHIASVTAVSATVKLAGDHYALTLPEDFTLTAEDIDLIRSGKVVVQNRSATGNGFMIDNVKIHNIVGRMLLKGGPGIVKNCTLKGMGYNAIVAQVEVSTWPEAGYLHDVQIINNLFDSNNARATCSNDWLKAGNMVDIQIIGTSGSSVTSAEDCMNANILISGNVFQNRYANYAIRVNAVSDLIIRNNTFLPKHGETAQSDTNTPILIIGGNGIIVEDNACPENVSAVVENRFSIPGVSGNNVP